MERINTKIYVGLKRSLSKEKLVIFCVNLNAS